MHGIVLRQARRSDLPLIGKLCARSVASPEEGIGYPRCEDETELLAELALYENTFEDNIVVVCDEANTPVGFAGFLVSDTDEASYLIGPMLEGPLRNASVAAEVLIRLVRLPIGGRPLLNYVVDDNSMLTQALRDTGWQAGEVHLEMRYQLAGVIAPVSGDDTHAIRRMAGPADPAFSAVAELLARQHGWTSDSSARLSDYLEDGYFVAVSERNGRLAGCVLWVYLDGTDFGRLDYLSVDEPFQRRSCGSALTRHMLADAHRTDGVEYVYLSVDPTNTAAHRLYRRHGFTDNLRSRKFTHERR